MILEDPSNLVFYDSMTEVNTKKISGTFIIQITLGKK